VCRGVAAPAPKLLGARLWARKEETGAAEVCHAVLLHAEVVMKGGSFHRVMVTDVVIVTPLPAQFEDLACHPQQHPLYEDPPTARDTAFTEAVRGQIDSPTGGTSLVGPIAIPPIIVPCHTCHNHASPSRKLPRATTCGVRGGTRSVGLYNTNISHTERPLSRYI
jgi:hypothetical protein